MGWHRRSRVGQRYRFRVGGAHGLGRRRVGRDGQGLGQGPGPARRTPGHRPSPYRNDRGQPGPESQHPGQVGACGGRPPRTQQRTLASVRGPAGTGECPASRAGVGRVPAGLKPAEFMTSATTTVVRDTPSDRHFPAWSRPKPAPERYLGKHFVHRVTDCAESDLDWLPSAQNVTLCTKCSALHKTFPYTPSPARPGVTGPRAGRGSHNAPTVAAALSAWTPGRERVTLPGSRPRDQEPQQHRKTPVRKAPGKPWIATPPFARM